MKKTKTKAFSNLVISILLFAFEVWAYIETTGFRTRKNEYVQPATFPQVMIAGMALFTAILFIQSAIKVFKGMRPDDYENEPAPSLNPFSNRGLAASYLFIALCFVYVLVFKTMGYVAVSIIICVIVMWMLGKRDLKIAISVSILVPLVMWFVFYKQLSVNIPMGILKPLQNLVDMI